MTRAGEAAEAVRYLVARLGRVNRLEIVDPGLVDMLLDAIPALLHGHDPHAEKLARAALDAVEAQTTIIRALFDDVERRRLQMYLTLPGPDATRHRTPRMHGEV